MTDPHARKADLTIGGLRIWVHGLQFPESDDYWDGNWVVVTAQCRSPQSSVRAEGPIVHLGEIADFLKGCEALYANLRGSAVLSCMEPSLRAELTAGSLGHIQLVISLTPDHLAEQHTFRSELDQSFLPAVIAGCQEILQQFPLKGQPEGEGVEQADEADKARDR
jgi:hypothetical protein